MGSSVATPVSPSSAEGMRYSRPRRVEGERGGFGLLSRKVDWQEGLKLKNALTTTQDGERKVSCHKELNLSFFMAGESMHIQETTNLEVGCTYHLEYWL